MKIVDRRKNCFLIKDLGVGQTFMFDKKDRCEVCLKVNRQNDFLNLVHFGLGSSSPDKAVIKVNSILIITD